MNRYMVAGQIITPFAMTVYADNAEEAKKAVMDGGVPFGNRGRGWLSIDNELLYESEEKLEADSVE